MILINTLCDDLELRLTSAKPTQDFEVPKAQLIHWIDIARDQLTRTLIDGSKLDIDESIVAYFEDIPISVEESTNKVKSQLPYLPLDLNKGRGVISVLDSNGRAYSRVSPEVNRFIGKMTFTKTSDCILTYSLYNGELILNGIDPMFIDGLTMKVAFIPAETNRDKSIDSIYYIMPSTVKDILEEAEKIGIREISQGIYDISNDGKTNSDS